MVQNLKIQKDENREFNGTMLLEAKTEHCSIHGFKIEFWKELKEEKERNREREWEQDWVIAWNLIFVEYYWQWELIEEKEELHMDINEFCPLQAAEAVAP